MDGSSVLQNVLFILVILTFIASLIGLVILCRKVLLNRCCTPVISLLRKLERKLMFNAVIRAILESYLSVCIQMLYGWRNTRIEPGLLPRIDFLLLLALTVHCVVFPIWQLNFLRRNRTRVQHDSNFAERFDSLYLNINTRSYESLSFTFVFLGRRLAFAYTICHLDSTLPIQILIVDGLSTSLLSFYVGS